MARTILVTGATGYIGKHIVLCLLDAGHTVIGSARSVSRDAEMRSALAPALKDPTALERYRTVALDLNSDDGWSEAMQGVDVLMHTASPFPISPPKNPDDLIRPAVDGMLRALRSAHAAGVRNVVATSSSAAIMGSAETKETFDETDWSDPDKPGISAYSLSKTLAEQAAWNFVRSEAPEMRLAIINPCLVLGPPLDSSFGTSVALIERVLRGKDPMLPRLGFPCCDVRDVAEAHVRAIDVPGTEAGRHLIFDRFMWFEELSRIIKATVPGAKPPTRVAPDLFMRFLGIFDSSIRGILPELGRVTKADNTRMRNVLGIEPRDTRDSVAETALWLMKNRKA